MNTLPDGSYVKSIEFGGHDLMKSGVDLSSGGGGKLEIALSPNAAEVSGVAAIPREKPCKP